MNNISLNPWEAVFTDPNQQNPMMANAMGMLPHQSMMTQHSMMAQQSMMVQQSLMAQHGMIEPPTTAAPPPFQTTKHQQQQPEMPSSIIQSTQV